MVDITKSCRTCMKNNVTFVGLYEIIEVDENDFQFADLLMQCTAKEVSKEDGLPQHLCVDCVQSLQVAFSFRIQALKAHDAFRKLLQTNIKTEPQEVPLKTENDHDYFDTYDDYDFNTEISKTEFEESEYTCATCNKRCPNEKKYLKHLEAHESGVLECSICKKVYQNLGLLNKHKAKHHDINVCIICNQEFESESRLLEHMVQHTGDIEVKTEKVVAEQILNCTLCNLTFNKQRSLSMHMRKHMNETKNKIEKKEFICDTCGKIFGMKHLLKRHVVMHSAVKPYKCSKCSKTFSRRDQLVSHMYTHKENKPYVCTYCKKSFAQTCTLKDHLRTHTGETPYLCSQCGKSFSNNSNLRQHMMRHTGLKPYACPMCPKTFCTKGQMTSHVATHSGEHPFKCEECGAAFTKHTSLKKHSMIHLAVRPFACETCNMRFTCKDHLKRHNRIHTGEKPYKCKYCERAFSQSNDLVKHTRSHIGQNIYQCTICATSFRLLSELKQHYPVHFTNDKGEDTNPKFEDITKEHSGTLEDSGPKELPLLDLKPPQDFNLPPFKNNKDLPLILKPEVDKNSSMLSMKPPPTNLSNTNDSLCLDPNRIVITIDRCDTNGVVNGITIKLPPKES